jgi:hypothetical protein
MTNIEHTEPAHAAVDEEQAVSTAVGVDEYGVGEAAIGAPLVFALLAGLGTVLAVLTPVTVVRVVSLLIVAVAGVIAFRLLTRRGGASR